MSMVLQVVTRAVDDGHEVHWKLKGSDPVRLLKVAVKEEVSDPSIVAELAALQHLLSVRQVLGSHRTGNGVTLEVSLGGIRKLHRGVSAKRDIVPYAVWLSSRYHDAKIEVVKNPGWLSGAVVSEAECLVVAAPPNEAIESPTLGEVVITLHGFERFQERMSSGEMARPWVSLQRRLQNPELRRVVLPARIEKHKARAFGGVQEIWRHPDDVLHFVLVPQEGRRVLVTVFSRNDTRVEPPS